MQSNFRVDVRSENGSPLLSVSGELDLATGPTLERELELALAGEPGLVILDLRQLEFMDSTGLSVLIRAHNTAQSQGQRLGIVGGSRQVRRLLNLTGVAERLTVVDSPEALR
jgi:anti-anti-sigma factor